MKIENLKELQKLISACRRLGVQAIKLGEVEFSLGPVPTKSKSIIMDESFPEANIQIPQFNGGAEQVTTVAHIKQATVDARGIQSIADQIATDELTPDQLLFYSSADRLETQQQ